MERIGFFSPRKAGVTTSLSLSRYHRIGNLAGLLPSRGNRGPPRGWEVEAALDPTGVYTTTRSGRSGFEEARSSENRVQRLFLPERRTSNVFRVPKTGQFSLLKPFICHSSRIVRVSRRGDALEWGSLGSRCAAGGGKSTPRGHQRLLTFGVKNRDNSVIVSILANGVRLVA